MPKIPRSLMVMLTYRRPYNTKTEEDFVARFLVPLGLKPDFEGNMIRRIGTAPVMWSCHTDTVHKEEGRQRVHVELAKGKVRLADGETSNCLGADDTAGVWLMCEMIRANVEGLYIFHRGEEVGGIGSSYIAKDNPELLTGIQMAIALDRKGKQSVITNQIGRCCSDEFADELGKAIGLGMYPDETGLFTDTANYTGLIPECTNLSVGYDGAHSPKETLDVAFLLTLRERLIKLDTTKLPIKRDHTIEDKWDDYRDVYGYRGMGSDGPAKSFESAGSVLNDDYMELMYLCEAEPETVADVMLHYGITPQEIKYWNR